MGPNNAFHVLIFSFFLFFFYTGNGNAEGDRMDNGVRQMMNNRLKSQHA